MTTTFDFQDGNGPVPAHQHPNGGGWVADTASVAETAFVGLDAWVYGDARVSDNARVYGNAEVSGDAWVSGDARVYGNTWVFDNARVSGNAEVSGNARVYGTATVYGAATVSGNTWVSGNAWVYGDAVVNSTLLTAIRSDNYTFAVFKCTDGLVRYTAGCRYFTYDEAVEHWTRTRGGTKLGKESILLINHLKTMFELQSD